MLGEGDAGHAQAMLVPDAANASWSLDFPSPTQSAMITASGGLAMRAAANTISFETYIYWRGGIANQFADALAEKARSGVLVKVLLDGRRHLGGQRSRPEKCNRPGSKSFGWGGQSGTRWTVSTTA